MRKRTGSYRFISLVFLLLNIFAAFGQNAPSATFYVAPGGNDNHTGSKSDPFLTLERAQKAIEMTKDPLNATVYLRAGNYHLKKSFVVMQAAIDSSRQVVYSSYNNEKVAISGSLTLDNSKFAPVNDPAILNRLPAVAKGKVVQIDLTTYGITDYGKRTPHGANLKTPSPPELFYNEAPLTVARWPNTDLAPIGKVLDPGSVKGKAENYIRGAKFVVNTDRAKNWKNATNAWVAGIFSYGYSDENFKVDTVDPASNAVRLDHPSDYSIYSSIDAGGGAVNNARTSRGFYIYNLLEELDTAGEYYVDEDTHKLYLWPPDNAIRTADIELSMLDDPLVVLSNTDNVLFKGITFECSRGIGLLAENTRNTTVTNCVFTDLGLVGISTGNQIKQKRMQFNTLVANNRMPLPYNTNLLIRSCKIYNVGTGGVLLEGGDRKDLHAANNRVDNCEMYKFSRINLTFSPAVRMDGVGNQITHCYIHDVPSQAIMYQGNNHLISYNRISHVGYDVTDAGAIYTGRDISATGTTISYNLFDNIGNNAGGSVAAVYFDDGSGGMEVDNNIFYKAGSPGTYHFGAIHINGGANNYFRNNYFIDCFQVFSNSPWNDQQWRTYISTQPGVNGLNAPANIRSAAYLKQYPELAKLADSNSIAPRHNYTFNTLVFNTPAFSSGSSFINANTVTGTLNPGFSDGTDGHFTLLNYQAALKQAGDWKPIPIAQIGLLKQ